MGTKNIDLHKLLMLTFLAAVILLSISVRALADDSDDGDDGDNDTGYARSAQVTKTPS